MNASASRVVRWWHLLVPGRRSVARPSDRCQAGLLLLSVLVALAAVPFSAVAGSEQYAREMRVSAEQLAERSQATAILLADSQAEPVTGPTGVSPNSAPTDATWQAPDGSRRVGKVAADDGTHRGDAIAIWVDRAGNPVAAPLTAVAAVVDAVCAGVALWAAVWVLLALLYGGVVFVLNRRRSAWWQREWDDEQTKRTHS
ncbi:MAG TPA: hypothetical protein VG674_12335 [Amycolatopsis sp.]|nr:hypothetical protein [Amycolatopsis sp.]